MRDHTFRVVSPEEAAAEVYPYVHVNEDGSARELHASEREYLETPFMPNDSARPYVKQHYESRSGWFGISGFCRRSELPYGIEVAAAPTEDPSRRLTIDDIRDMLRERYEAPESRKAPTALPKPAPRRLGLPPAEAPRRPPATASPPGQMSWKFGVGVLLTIAFVLLRSAIHHPQLKDRHRRQTVRPDQGERGGEKQSIPAPGLSSEDFVQRINAYRFTSIVACQRRLGISDEALDSLLKRAWRAQHPDRRPPWESEVAGGDWRTSVTWNVEAVEKALGQMAAGNERAPAGRPR